LLFGFAKNQQGPDKGPLFLFGREMVRVGFREWIAVGRVFANGRLLRTDDGLQRCQKFEKDLATFTGTSHALALSSGTAGLVCALQACGIGPGDEVLVPAYTWMATAGAVLLVGAVPVLVEIDETLTMDVADMAAKVTDRCRAVIPVHMINRPCDMDGILGVARARGLRVIEDASQAIGVKYKGRQCGSMGDIGVYSFNQHKNMTCGEGGAVVTNDHHLFERAMNAHDMGISYRTQTSNGNTPVFLGHNYRISEIQGAILGVQLSRLRGRIKRMRRRTIMLERVLGGKGFAVAPQNDPEGALGLAVTFATAQDAIAFAQKRGVRRLLDNSKHVYTKWHPILERRMSHSGLDPWEWAGIADNREINACPRTLDVMGRTCAVDLMMRAPSPVARIMAGQMAACSLLPLLSRPRRRTSDSAPEGVGGDSSG
jgi:dTDP-4-amino-4,6-dideoxygalactose transaminase